MAIGESKFMELSGVPTLLVDVFAEKSMFNIFRSDKGDEGCTRAYVVPSVFVKSAAHYIVFCNFRRSWLNTSLVDKSLFK